MNDPTQVDFHFPFPVLRTVHRKDTLVSSQIEIVDTDEGKRLKIRFLDITARHPSTNEISLDLPNAILLSNLVTKTVPQVGLYGKSDYCTVMEAPNGKLYFMLSEKGKEILEEETDVAFLLDAIRGTKLEVHSEEQIHQFLPPPYVTLDWKTEASRMWYFKASVNKGTLAFRDELLKNGWAKMEFYLK
tara:strand:+ start:1063 stop:1626 length:564 start_codon:yes stop_codon:yes gene_type:complete